MTTWTLTANDRCDAPSCGARAYVRIVMPTTLNDLLFCAHHGTQYEDVLKLQHLIVYDEREAVNQKLDASPA